MWNIAGTAGYPTYNVNRIWDPNQTLLGTYCITTKGAVGTLQDKCAISPITCGYLYCDPN